MWVCMMCTTKAVGVLKNGAGVVVTSSGHLASWVEMFQEPLGQRVYQDEITLGAMWPIRARCKRDIDSLFNNCHNKVYLSRQEEMGRLKNSTQYTKS